MFSGLMFNRFIGSTWKTEKRREKTGSNKWNDATLTLPCKQITRLTILGVITLSSFQKWSKCFCRRFLSFQCFPLIVGICCYIVIVGAAFFSLLSYIFSPFNAANQANLKFAAVLPELRTPEIDRRKHAHNTHTHNASMEFSTDELVH